MARRPNRRKPPARKAPPQRSEPKGRRGPVPPTLTVPMHRNTTRRGRR